MKEELKKLLQEYIKDIVGEGVNPGDFWKIITFRSFAEWLMK